MIISLGKFHSHLKGLIYVLFVLEKAIHQIYGHSGLSVWSLHFVPGPVWVPSGHSINLPQPKHMHARLICDSELGVNVKVNACLSQLALQQTVDLSKLHPAPCFVTAGIGSTPTHPELDKREKMNGWILNVWKPSKVKIKQHYVAIQGSLYLVTQTHSYIAI